MSEILKEKMWDEFWSKGKKSFTNFFVVRYHNYINP